MSDSYNGKVNTGLFFSGENGYRIEKLVSVEELINELMREKFTPNILIAGKIDKILENNLASQKAI